MHPSPRAGSCGVIWTSRRRKVRRPGLEKCAQGTQLRVTPGTPGSGPQGQAARRDAAREGHRLTPSALTRSAAPTVHLHPRIIRPDRPPPLQVAAQLGEAPSRHTPHRRQWPPLLGEVCPAARLGFGLQVLVGVGGAVIPWAGDLGMCPRVGRAAQQWRGGASCHCVGRVLGFY